MSNIGLVNEPYYQNSYDLVPLPYYYPPSLSSPLFHSSANYQQPHPILFHSSAYQQPYPGLFPPLQANDTDGNYASVVNFSGKRSIPTHGWHYNGLVPPFVNYPKTEETVALLKERILKQIEYYFSDENLKDDYYLKSLMNGEGWVCISAIAEFRRIKRMCIDITFILNALKGSAALIEVDRHMIRRRPAPAQLDLKFQLISSF